MIGTIIDNIKIEEAVNSKNIPVLREVLKQYRLEEELVADHLNALRAVISSLLALIVLLESDKGEK